MRISDWSSDVCSSDLQILRQHPADEGAGTGVAFQVAFAQELVEGADHGIARAAEFARQRPAGRQARARREAAGEDDLAHLVVELLQIGSSSCRERVSQYGSLLVVAVSLKKKIYSINLVSCITFIFNT